MPRADSYTDDSPPLTYIVRGVERLASLVAATYGPHKGTVLQSLGNGRPEIIGDGGTVAARLVALADPRENAAALVLREMAQELHTQCLDGVVTACLLVRAIVREARKAIAGGANPMQVRQGIDRGTRVALRALPAFKFAVDSEQTLRQVAETAGGSPEMSRALAEMFDVLGVNGAYLVEEYAAPTLNTEYVDGGRWRCRPASRALMPAAGADLVLDKPLLWIADAELSRVDQVEAVLRLVAEMPGKRPLLMVARDLKGVALEAVILNHSRGVLTVGAALSTAPRAQQSDDLDDMALLAGTEVMRAETDRLPENTRIEHLGGARTIRLSADSLTLAAQDGQIRNSSLRQQRIAELRGRLKRSTQAGEERERLRIRLSRLSGSMAILRVGAFTFRERETMKAQAKKLVSVLEGALAEGALPGGGAAYLACAPAVLAEAECAEDADVRAGIKAVAEALRTPMMQLAANTGVLHPPLVIQQAVVAGMGFGLDVRTSQVASMVDAGVLDSFLTLKAALEAAGSAAGMLVTIERVLMRGR